MDPDQILQAASEDLKSGDATRMSSAQSTLDASGAQAIPYIIPLLANSDSKVGQAAAWLCKRIMKRNPNIALEPEDVAGLAAGLSNENQQIRNMVAYAAFGMGPSTIEPVLLSILARKGDQASVETATYYFNNLFSAIPDGSSIPGRALVTAVRGLDALDERTTKMLGWALGRIGRKLRITEDTELSKAFFDVTSSQNRIAADNARWVLAKDGFLTIRRSVSHFSGIPKAPIREGQKTNHNSPIKKS